MVEFHLGHLINHRANLNAIDAKVRDKLMKNKTLGQKIELSTSLIPSTLSSDLRLLNEKRIILSHSVIGEKVDISNPQQKTGDYVMQHNTQEHSLTISFTDKVIELAQSINSQIHTEFLRGTSLEGKL